MQSAAQLSKVLLADRPAHAPRVHALCLPALVPALLCPRHEPVSGPAVDEVEKDNRDLVDVNTSQTLTAEQIEAMKASGKVRRASPGVT